VPDACDLQGSVSEDCDLNGVPDECDSDCDGNGKPDACDVLSDGGLDCDSNGIPDSCELGLGDGDGNGLLDSCELARSPHLDCDGNGSLDLADLAPVFRLFQEEYPAGGAPESVALSDLDGDGDLDVAAAHHGVPPDAFLAGRPAGITILSNRGDGTMVRAREITFDAPVVRLEALDADRDGRVDLVTARRDRFCSNQGWISVLLNDGEPRFTRRAAHPIDSWPLSLRAADFDGDRVEEVLVATGYTSAAVVGIVSTLRGRGRRPDPPAPLPGRRRAGLREGRRCQR
jgi:hypothetical protein